MIDLLQKAKDLLSRRRRAYASTFRGPVAEVVLKDLARFCRANQTPYHPDHRMNDILLGRHEVWMRIQQHLQLTDDELWALIAPESKENP